MPYGKYKTVCKREGATTILKVYSPGPLLALSRDNTNKGGLNARRHCGEVGINVLSFTPNPVAMRKIYFSVLLFIAGSESFSQVNDSRVMIDTTYRPAIYFESNMGEDDTKNAIESYFDSLNISKQKGKGFIIKKSLGYMLFKQAKVDYVDDNIDCYFVVNEKKLKTGDAAGVYVAVNKNGNFVTPENNKDEWTRIKDYAAYLQQNYFEQYSINMQLTDIQKEMNKQNKKLAEINQQKLELETSISKDSALISGLQTQLTELRAKKKQ